WIGLFQPIFRAIGGDAVFDRVVQFLRGRPEIAAAGIDGVITVAGGGRARVKIFLGSEVLPEQFRAGDRSILVYDQAAVGLVTKRDLSYAENDQRIDSATNDP